MLTAISNEVSVQEHDQVRTRHLISQEYLEFLDALDARSDISMWQARPYLEAEFGISAYLAGKVVSYWRKTRDWRLQHDA